jgi:hypothetical protein
MADSRRKGKAAELEVCSILRDTGAFPDAERDLEQTRGHDNGRDIVNCDPFTIQVKRRKRITQAVIDGGLREAMASTTPDAPIAVVVTRSDREPWRVTFDIYQFCELAKVVRDAQTD